MSNSQKISQMSTATLPLSGSELVPIVQTGNNVSVSAFNLAASSGLAYQGLWNASTNSPTITSSVGTRGYYYIVGTAGATTVNGISTWNVGDWIIFSNTGVWQRIAGGVGTSLSITNDTTTNTAYNLSMVNATTGYASGLYVDSPTLTFNPSLGRLFSTGLTLSDGRGITLGAAPSPFYYYAPENRVTMANYLAGGKLAFEVNGGAYTAYFNADGTYQFANLYANAISSSPRAVYVDSTGIIGYVSSTKESKTNIEPIVDANWVSELKPVSFNRRKKNEDGSYSQEAYADKVYGLIAEDVETVNKDLCMYDGEKLVGINYDQLVVPLLKKVQELEARLAAVEAK
jgi:Chaperone of endosialidase